MNRNKIRKAAGRAADGFADEDDEEYRNRLTNDETFGTLAATHDEIRTLQRFDAESDRPMSDALEDDVDALIGRVTSALDERAAQLEEVAE